MTTKRKLTTSGALGDRHPGPAGSWSPADLRYQAENLVTMLVNNAGFHRSQKTVVRAPFRVTPKPVWFATQDGAQAHSEAGGV